jgi:hypothetical protein
MFSGTVPTKIRRRMSTSVFEFRDKWTNRSLAGFLKKPMRTSGYKFTKHVLHCSDSTRQHAPHTRQRSCRNCKALVSGNIQTSDQNITRLSVGVKFDITDLLHNTEKIVYEGTEEARFCQIFHRPRRIVMIFSHLIGRKITDTQKKDVFSFRKDRRGAILNNHQW